MKILFFSGARSEYGIIRKLMSKIKDDNFFNLSLIVGGMHLLNRYGYTLSEIEKDNFPIVAKISIFDENAEPDYSNFTKAINEISRHLSKNKYDAIFLIGDRFETYAAALAAHFSKLTIIHLGGGTITRGALDNLYRYNITNLSDYHFATSYGNYQRLLLQSIINKDNVHFTGTVAIDSIKEFQASPLVFIEDLIPGIKKNKFVLATFHSATKSNEPLHQILEDVANFIVEYGYQVLITFPNNDPGSKKILRVIRKLNSKRHIYTTESLGSYGYYAALSDCIFVIGNSSSGIIEAPYFNKISLNIGSRQDGRERDNSTIDVGLNIDKIKFVIQDVIDGKIIIENRKNIYGEGDSINKIINILKSNFN